MNLREVELLPSKTLDDSGTETIDIDELDPISKLDFRFGLTNGAAIAEDVPPQSIISKIEIVDGGRPWFSASGRQAFAVAAYEMKHFPKQWLMTMADLSQYIKLPILFGRYVGDTMFGFDPTKLRHPQIKFTYAKDDLHLTNTLTLGVFATMMDGVASPPKCLMTRVIREFTSAASGAEPTDLWTDNPMRRLFVQVGATTQRMDTVITNLKLIADEKLIFFDLQDEELADECEENFGVFIDRQFIDPDNSSYKYSRLGRVESVQCVAGDGGIIVSPWAASWAGIYFSVTDHAGTAQNNKDSTLTAFGTCPENTYCYPFGPQDDPDMWLPAQSYKKIKLELTQGVASQTIGILAQQPVVLTPS